LKNDKTFGDEAEYLNKMFDGWLKIDFPDMTERLAHNQKSGAPYLFEAQWAPRGDKKVYESTALFLVEDIDQGSHAIAGVAFDADYLKDHFFPGNAGCRSYP